MSSIFLIDSNISFFSNLLIFSPSSLSGSCASSIASISFPCKIVNLIKTASKSLFSATLIPSNALTILYSWELSNGGDLFFLIQAMSNFKLSLWSICCGWSGSLHFLKYETPLPMASSISSSVRILITSNNPF